jgi:hypothetical protein
VSLSRRNAAAIRSGILAARRAIGLSRDLTRGHVRVRVQGGHFERAVRHTVSRYLLTTPAAYHPGGAPKIRVHNR